MQMLASGGQHPGRMDLCVTSLYSLPPLFLAITNPNTHVHNKMVICGISPWLSSELALAKHVTKGDRVLDRFVGSCVQRTRNWMRQRRKQQRLMMFKRCRAGSGKENAQVPSGLHLRI